MSQLLKKRHFMSNFKITSLHLWKKLHSRNHHSYSATLFNKAQRKFSFVPATSTGIFLPSKQYSSIQLFPCLGDSNSLSSSQRCLIMNQYKNNNCLSRRHRSLNMVNFATASFSENADVVMIGSHKHPDHEFDRVQQEIDKELRAHVDSFKETLQNCNSVDEILTIAEKAMQTKSLHVDCISILFAAYYEQVYKTFTFPWLLTKNNLKKRQLEESLLCDQVMEPYITNTRFQNLVAYAEILIEDISFDDCLYILDSLQYLNINNSSLASKIVDKCAENLNTFNLKQLAWFSSCYHSHRRDTYLLCKILDAAKTWLMTHSTTEDIVIEHLCQLFVHTRLLASNDMCELGAQIITRKLASDPSCVSQNMIGWINSFVRGINTECRESIINSFLNLPPHCFSINVSDDSLTFDACSSFSDNSWLSAISQKLRAQCILVLNTSNQVTIQEMVPYSLLLRNHLFSIPENKRKLLVQSVKDSDNFLLFQLITNHSGEAVRQLPEIKEIFLAYHKRLIKLFASLSQTQQEKFLWNSNGCFGRHVFEIIDRFEEFGISINPDLLRTLDGHFKLQSDEWDVPPLKVVVATLYVMKKLRSNNRLLPDEMAAFTKFLHRLDLLHLMDFYKKFERLALLSHTTSSVKQQCLEIRKVLFNCFQSKLSNTEAFSSCFVSNKLLPFAKKSHYSRTIGTDIYIELMNSLPRLLGDNEKNFMWILKLLDLSCEKCPVYQGETFEKLITFVTSSPKLLVHSGIHLVKTLAHCGHQLNNFESFVTWSQLLVTQVKDHALISKSMLVQIAYHLSLIGIFHDELLLKIFSLDFLSGLDQDLENESVKTLGKVKNELALLNRSVSIECPHLAVSWFSRPFLLNEAEPESQCFDTFDLSSVVDSISRLTGQTGCVVTFAESPYAHNIDALMYFDPSSGVVRIDDVQNSQALSEVEKIAMLALQHYDFCLNGDFLTGKCQAGIRELQILGYTVILFTERELSSLGVHLEKDMDKYVGEKIISATRSKMFKDIKEEE